MRIIGIVLFLVLDSLGTISGQLVSIHGQDDAYSEKSIRIYEDQNPFIAAHEDVEPVFCNKGGYFECELKVSSETVIHFETGVYRAYLYVEPGYNYEVELPEYRELAYAERISPYFQYIETPLKVISRSTIFSGRPLDPVDDLNHMIGRFDSIFANMNDAVITNRRMGKKSEVDSIILGLESEYASDTSHFFADYRRYKYGSLKLNEGKTGLEEISLNFLGPQINYTHPGFIELFGAMFKEFLFYYSRTSSGKDLMRHINRTHDLDSVRVSLRNHPAVWNDTLADMILLQEFTDLFYAGDFHKEAILILLDSMEIKAENGDFAEFAAQLNHKLSNLMIGRTPPRFSLPDLTGKRYSMEDFEGKYVYLMFCTPDHYGCMMEYPFLQSFHQKHAAYLEVITVMVTDDESQLLDFMKRNGYDWKTLFFEDQQEVLSAYLVKAFPTAYLIGPDGTLVLSPSSLPTDGFEQQLFRIMRSRGEI